MARDPILPLYYNDLDRSTKDWTDEEFGAYVRLLMHQWDRGSLPIEPQRLARIITSFQNNWGLLKEKFTESAAGLKNLRMEEIREKRKVFREKQFLNGMNGGRKPKINPNETQTLTQSGCEGEAKKKPLEIENEIEKEIENVKQEKGVQREKPKPQKTDFVKPTKSELTNFFADVGLDDFTAMAQAQLFLDHYDSNGWLVGGRAAMKDWKAAARNWKSNINQFNRNGSFKNSSKPTRKTATQAARDILRGGGEVPEVLKGG